MTLQILANGLLSAATIAMVAVGLSLIFRVTRLFHLAHALLFSAPAYCAYWLTKEALFPPPVAMLLSLAFGTALGMLLEFSVYLPLRKRHAPPLVCMVASLGILVLGQNTLSLLFGDETKSLRSAAQQQALQVADLRITAIQLLTLALGTVSCIGVSLFLHRSKFGKAVRALASDAELSDAVGIPTRQTSLCVFAIASALAALAGLLAAYDVDVSPTAGFDVMLLALTAAVIGGIQSDWGPILGAIVVGCVHHLSGWFWPTHWQNAAVFSLFILLLLVRPTGLFGRPSLNSPR